MALDNEPEHLQCWEINFSDLIVATSKRQMREIYMMYIGESIRGNIVRLIEPKTPLILHYGDEATRSTYGKYAEMVGIGYYPDD